jgi:hypothetical protein
MERLGKEIISERREKSPASGKNRRQIHSGGCVDCRSCPIFARTLSFGASSTAESGRRTASSTGWGCTLVVDAELAVDTHTLPRARQRPGPVTGIILDTGNTVTGTGTGTEVYRYFCVGLVVDAHVCNLYRVTLNHGNLSLVRKRLKS